MSRNTVLLVEDEETIRESLQDFFESSGYDVVAAPGVKRAEELIRLYKPDVAILDFYLQDSDALVAIPSFKALDPVLPIVVLSGQGSIDLAVKAVKEGAEHFLTKPVQLPALRAMVERMVIAARSSRRDVATRKARRASADPFIGTSRAIRQLAERAEIAAEAQSPVLLLGETGAGKGVLARWIHERSPRGDEPFVDLNCAGLSKEFLETELFGHEKGAFTGAVAAKQGLLEVAHRGSLFLDEIGDVDLQVQPKLLKVLEEKRFRRLGEVRDRSVDIRLIAATHHELERVQSEGKFRRDLYFRINTLTLHIPPLRERREDIPAIALHLLGSLAAQVGRAAAELSEDAAEALRQASWPGNIRELRNVLERALLTSRGSVITPSALQLGRTSPGVTSESYDHLTLEQMEEKHIRRALELESGSVEKAARRLGLARSSLYYKIKRLGIDLSSF